MLRYFSAGYRDFNEEPDISCRRLNWEFFAVLEGTAAPEYTEEELPIKKQGSSVWLTRPMKEYRWCTGKEKVYRCSFHYHSPPDVVQELLGDKPFFHRRLNVEEADRIRGIAEQTKEQYMNPTKALYLYSMKALYDLCIILTSGITLPNVNRLDSIPEQRVRRAETFFRERIRQRPTLQQIAEAAGISESQLRNHFKHVRGTSPTKTFKKVRIEESCLLLSETDLTLDQIAIKCGFNSPVDFHRTFKELMKTTPHTWRKTHLANPEKWRAIKRFP